MDAETRDALKQQDARWDEISAFMAKINERFAHGQIVTKADCLVTRVQCDEARRKPWHTVICGVVITVVNVTIWAFWHWMTQHKGGH